MKHLEIAYCYGGIVSYEPGESLGPRLLSDFEAVLIIEGHPIHQTENGNQHLEPGSILVTTPNTRESYIWDKTKKTRHAYLHFDLTSYPDEWGDVEKWPVLHRSPSVLLNRLLKTLIERAISRPQWPTEKPGMRQNRLMEAFLDQFIHFEHEENAFAYQNYSETVNRSIKFMRERLDTIPFEPFDLEEIAAYSYTSSKNLCRVFQKELRMSPIKTSRLMQLQLAIPLLARTNMSIKEIAQRCGFPDQLYFSRYFTRTLHASPTQVRVSITEGNPPPKIGLPAILTPRIHW